ncbi:MAG: hypothetical protein Kow0092_28200 [Deferrisomatales bacterium]
MEEHFRRGIDHLLDLLQVRPDLVACDLHPQYVSSRYAREWEEKGVPVVRVQHHAAHGAACMAEHRHEGPALCLALDGLGYGEDGTLWGGEILLLGPEGCRRLGHLTPVPQPGGDRAAREPWRMAASHLRRLRGPAWTELPLAAFRHVSPEDRAVVETLMARGVHAPLTSSCGRLFDAAAAILGFRGAVTYSAQAPMELEALAARWRGPAEPYPTPPPEERDGCLVLDPGPLLEALLEDALKGGAPGRAARAFHAGLARLFADGLEEAARATGLDRVFLSGGCLQNALLARLLVEELQRRGLSPRTHREVPPNDGGIALGQAAWALRFPGG